MMNSFKLAKKIKPDERMLFSIENSHSLRIIQQQQRNRAFLSLSMYLYRLKWIRRIRICIMFQMQKIKNKKAHFVIVDKMEEQIITLFIHKMTNLSSIL